MQAMKDFTLWLINNIPIFLMSEPIIYLVAIALITLVIKAFAALFFTERRY